MASVENRPDGGQAGEDGQARVITQPGPVTRPEWRWVVIVTLLVMGVSLIPAIYGVTHEPEGKIFLWTNELSARDLYTYFAWMEQSARGHILTMNPFTTEDHGRLLFRPLLVLGGWLARLPGVSPMGAWQLLRLVGGVALLLLAYRWIALFLHGRHERRVAFLVTATSSGIGWLANRAGWGWNPTDMWVPESITFLSIYHYPHFAVSLALMLFILIRFHEALLGRSGRSAPAAIPAGIAAFFLAWIHPFDVVSVLAILAAWTAYLAWRGGGEGVSAPTNLRLTAIRTYLLIVLFIVPVVLWQVFLLGHEPVYEMWTRSIHGGSPAPLSYIAGFGLLLPLAAVGAIRCFAGRRAGITNDRPTGNAHDHPIDGGPDSSGGIPLAILIMPLLWIGVTIILVYAPVGFQRRLVQGVHLPLSLLAGCGITVLLERLRLRAGRPARALILAPLLLLLALSNVDRLRLDIADYATGRAPYYLAREYFDAFQWLRRETSPDDAVLSSIQVGSFIPAFAGNRVFLGHGELTVGAHEKMDQAERFFRGGMSPAAARSFLEFTAARYIFVSPVERASGADWLRTWADASPVYENPVVTILEKRAR